MGSVDQPIAALRIGNFAVTRGPAYKLDARRYLFDPLGRDLPLYNRPITETQISHLAEALNVPDQGVIPDAGKALRAAVDASTK